jgi:hypothetical protein
MRGTARTDLDGTAATGAIYVTSPGQIVFASVGGSLPVGAIVIWFNTGTASTSPLIAYIDSTGTSGTLPVTPNGSSITLTVPQVSPGIFLL